MADPRLAEDKPQPQQPFTAGTTAERGEKSAAGTTTRTTTRTTAEQKSVAGT